MTKEHAEKIIDESISDLAQIISRGASWETREREVSYMHGLLTGLYFGDVLNALEYREQCTRVRKIHYGEKH